MKEIVNMKKNKHKQKYKGNTHYNIHVIDSFGQEHHLGFERHPQLSYIERQAEEIWSNETKNVYERFTR
jgi:hypothetical protein